VGTLIQLHDARRQSQDRRGGGRLACPFCNSYDVGRLYLASVNLDSCQCVACGARWDEECGSGEYRGRAHRSSVLMPRDD
jgi:hypothetical protein